MKKSLLKIFIFISALTFSNSVWGFTSTADQSTLDDNFNNSKKSVSWDGNHVSFTLKGNDLYTALGYLYIPHNATYTLSWSVESGYDITVKTVAVNVDRASGTGYKMTVGNGTQSGNLFYTLGNNEIKSGTLNYGNAQSVSIVVCKAKTWSTCAVNSIIVEYDMKPQINASNGTVKVTICDDNKKTIDLKDLAKPVVTSGHVSYSYSIVSVVPAANTSATTSTGHISGSTFYATQAGVYTLRISAKSATCHQANSKTFTVTVTPAALSLKAPTASDIIYPATLASSSLTGGSAMVGTCEVGGKWAWQTPSTSPSVGDNQLFPVVFTPSANAGNYTNFITNAKVNVLAYIFTGEGDDDEKANIWTKGDNWNVNNTPTIENVVIIRHDVIVEDEVFAYSVEIETGYSLTIAPTGGLTVGAGGISGATKDNLFLKAGQTGDTKGKTGYLRVSPYSSKPMPEATVDLYSTACQNSSAATGNKTRYQCVGAPIADEGVAASQVYIAGTWLYTWNENDETWTNNRTKINFTPFKGYDVSQKKQKDGYLFTYSGHLVSGNTLREIDLECETCTDKERGYNLLANSYSAPIDIEMFDESDFVNAVPTIFFLNAGTNAESLKPADDKNAAGKWVGAPVNTISVLKSEGYPCVIPSMQGFWVKAKKSDAKLKLDYDKLVWRDGAGFSGLNENKSLRTPKRNTNDVDSPISGKLQINISTEDDGDFLFMLESENYDASYEEGFDARRIASGGVDIFTIHDEDYLSVDATNSIAGTQIGVRTGDTTAYVMIFTHLSSERPLALLDKETNQQIDIFEGTEYTFFAVPNSEITGRFFIVESANAPTVTTGIEETNSGVKAQKFIKDGQLYILKNGVLYTATGAVVR